MLDKFHTSLAGVAKIMGSWLKETYISSYSRGYRIKQRKESKKDAVYFQPEDNHKTIAKRGKVLREKKWEKMVGQAVIPGNFKRRYERSPYDSGILIY